MKKFLMILCLCAIAGITKISASGKVVSEGRTYRVIVTYTTDYAYRKGYTVLASGINPSTSTEEFLAYAETKNDAESQAKEECYKVCSRETGRKVGETIYQGDKCDIIEFRRVESARAVED